VVEQIRELFLFRLAGQNNFRRPSLQVGNKPSKKQRRSKASEKLGGHEPRRVRRSNSRKSIAERPRDGNGWIRERCRGGKPVGGGDVRSDGEWNRVGPQVRATPDDTHQAEGGYKFTEALSGAAAWVLRERNWWQSKHQMCD
jgi:hypothetical protein